MLVKIHRDEFSRAGLDIGEANAMSYFSRSRPSIELSLDDLHIQCTLSPDFWQGRPEIHDPRLSEWLEFKMARQSQGPEPILLTLVPTGADTFVLRPHPESRYDAFGADVSEPRTQQRKPVLSHHPAPDRKVLSVA